MRTDNQTFSTIHTFFSWDHRRLEGQLSDVLKVLEDGDLPRARRLFAHYERGMRRHMRIEEEVIFQLYAFERTGPARSPGPTIAAEHAEILRMIDEIGKAIADEDVPRFHGAYERLMAFLPGHLECEENALYPYLDALVGSEEAEHMVSRLRSE